MPKDRYTEERDKQEEAKKLRGKKANEIIIDPTIEDLLVDPVVKATGIFPSLDYDFNSGTIAGSG